MNKRKQQPDRTSILLIIFGIVAVVITPLVQFLLGFLFTLHCPTVDGSRVCDFATGLSNASYISIISIAWVVVGTMVLITGILAYFTKRK